MAARKRASSDSTAKSTPTTETQNHKSQDAATTTTTNIPSSSAASPAKAGQILKVSLIFFIPYFYLIFYHYGTSIEAELKRSILINALLSFTGFFLTLVLIPVASRYVLRRNMFGYDINKKGTPQGSVKVLSFSCFYCEYF